jgi:hypothetical protein
VPGSAGTRLLVRQVQGGSTHERTSSLAATASIATSGQRDLNRLSVLGAQTMITTASRRDHLRLSGLTAIATVQTAPQRDHLRLSHLAVTALLDTKGEVEGYNGGNGQPYCAPMATDIVAD